MANPPNPPLLPEAQLGPAEKLLDLVLSSSAHLWHNRPGLNVRNVWQPAPKGRAAGTRSPRPSGVTWLTPAGAFAKKSAHA